MSRAIITMELKHIKATFFISHACMASSESAKPQDKCDLHDLKNLRDY